MRERSVAQLLGDYAMAAVNHREASRAGDYEKVNPAADALTEIVRVLRDRGDLARLLSLLNDDRVEVRGWAAAHSLEIAPERAERVLETIAAGPKSLEEFSARMVLREWRSGSLRFP